MELVKRLLTWWDERDIERRIKRYGWTAIYVGDYQSAPTWAYTLGFGEALNHPELLVFDVTQEIANSIFWDARHDIASASLRIEDGLVWPPESERPGVWRKVLPDQVDEWLPLACKRRFALTGQRTPVEAFQLVLSDEGGRMPREPGYNEQLRPLQPALYFAPDETTAPAASSNSKVAAGGAL